MEKWFYYQTVWFMVIKNWKFIKEQEASGLLLGLNSPLKYAPVLAIFQIYKMNEIINKFLVAGDKFMPEMHLTQPRLTYSAFGSFTKNKVRMQKFKGAEDSNYVY